MRARIKGVDGTPMLYVFDTCRDFIRTVPVLQHDPMRLEDLDTAAEDHIADEARYVCSCRPMTARRAATPTRADDAWTREWGRGVSWKTMDSWKVL
jgi:hypothetical protein